MRKCEHVRQALMPCATPGCPETADDDSISMPIIKPRYRAGSSYTELFATGIESEKVFLGAFDRNKYVTWLDRENEQAEIGFWVWHPRDAKAFKSCLRRKQPLFCPCGAFVGLLPLFRAYSCIARCQGCGHRWTPALDKDGVKVGDIKYGAVDVWEVPFDGV